MSKRMTEAQFEDELLTEIEDCYDDPLAYVNMAFAWGEGELEGHDGPDVWQRDLLIDIGRRIKADPEATIRDATSSGHGPGKTALTAWIIIWMMSTRPHLNAVVTANTTTQLSTKTWRELALWHKRAINGHWFKWTATRFFHVQHHATWFAAAIPNTEHNSEAFAGLHAQHVLLLFDEASGIPDKIWEVSEGAMTTPRAMWLVFGNPTRNIGRFADCFGKDKKRWNTRQIDSRTAKMTNKAEIQEWVDAYGEDSDFVRVRVRGVFPRSGSMQFLPTDLVDQAMAINMQIEVYMFAPIVIAVDVARYGDDKSVIVIRQGRKVLELRKFRGLNTMELCVEVIKVKQMYPTAVALFVDEIGIGAGVVDRLRMLGYEVIGVNAGVAAVDDKLYFNKRAEMYGRLRQWLRNGADIPMDPEMRTSMIGIEFGFNEKEQIRMERKKDMKKRGMDSPDETDALAYTFAEELGDFSRNSFEPEDGFEPEDTHYEMAGLGRGRSGVQCARQRSAFPQRRRIVRGVRAGNRPRRHLRSLRKAADRAFRGQLSFTR